MHNGASNPHTSSHGHSGEELTKPTRAAPISKQKCNCNARLQWTALIALAAGYAICLWAMRVNRFFSSIVRIQNDRGQVVITTGPYAIIRHPGYLAGIVIVVASGLALDSWIAATMLMVCALPFLLYRAATEDRVLLAELPGYRDYAERVRWRLLPGIW